MASKFSCLKTPLRKNGIKNLIHLVEKHITDPRRTSYGHIKYTLTFIVVIYIVAKICGMFSFREVEDFGKSHIVFFGKFFEIKNNAIPSAERYRLVMSYIDSEELLSVYRDFFSINKNILYKKLHIAIDGKNVNGSRRRDENAKNIVSAINSEFDAIISQSIVDEKDSEIFAMLELITYMGKVGYKNLIITGDAIYAQINIVDQIIKYGWNYCFSLKGNQGKLFNVAKLIFEKVKDNPFSKDQNNLHGRRVYREFYYVENVKKFCIENNIKYNGKWETIPSIGIVKSRRIELEKDSTEVRYYITSLKDKNEFKTYATRHWYIENNLHWQLDTTYCEDSSRIYDKNLVMNNNICLKFGLKICNIGLEYYNKPNMTLTRIKKLMLMNPYNIEEFIG